MVAAMKAETQKLTNRISEFLGFPLPEFVSPGLKLFMAAAMTNGILTDGDAAFLRVDARRPAHALEPGVAASATNKRFDNGKPGPRLGVALDAWGDPRFIPVRGAYDDEFGHFTSGAILTSGGDYELRNNSGYAVAVKIFAGSTPVQNLGTLQTGASLSFTSLGDVLNLASASQVGDPVIGITLRGTRGIRTCAYERFNDPNSDTDNGLLITDDWRDYAGEDGGRGRAWRIRAGNAPQELPLNGHDVWATARLIQCHNAMMLLRHGNERHYFAAADVNGLLDRITLHCAPTWASGTRKRVRFEVVTEGLDIPGLSQTITDTDLATEHLTVAAHGLTTGAAKLVSGLAAQGVADGLYYVRNINGDSLALYDTYAHAIDTGSTTGHVDITADDGTGLLEDRAPATGNYYWAQYTLISATHILELYQDDSLTNKIIFEAAASGAKFYVELANDPLPWFGNGAPNLILQPSFAAGITTDAFDTGFVAITGNVAITVYNTSTDTITAPNHRLMPGDSVGLTSSAAPFTYDNGSSAQALPSPVYAFPASEHTFQLYSTLAGALAGGSTDRLNLDGSGTVGSVKKIGAAGLPMPPCREGTYINGRFWGIVGFDTLVQSDPFDFLHYTAFVGAVTANQGEAGRANWLYPIGEDAMLIGKNQKLIALSGISGPVTGWREGTVTREYGGIAALAVAGVGTDVQFASRKGWASATRTVAGERLGRAQTVSRSIAPLLKDIDWEHGSLMCAKVWNGRLFWSAPLKAQKLDAVANNATFVLNLDNSDLYLEQTVIEGQIVGRVREYQEGAKGPDSWEGVWTGDLLTPYAFAILTVNGEERLTFALPNGTVCWFHDGWDDAAADIADELLTRAYFGSAEVEAWEGTLQLETFQPKYSAYIRSTGFQEEEQLVGFNELEYDRTKYLVDGQADYDPDTASEADFNRPHRSDYSPADTDLAVSTLDVHQAVTEPFCCFVVDHGIQLRIANTQGSLKVCSTAVHGRELDVAATRKT